MSSHWEWAERVTREHDEKKPFAPENGQPLRYKIGDRVIYTNDYGVEFETTVVGFYERPSDPCGMYANGARYMLDTDAHWFPHKESELRFPHEPREVK